VSPHKASRQLLPPIQREGDAAVICQQQQQQQRQQQQQQQQQQQMQRRSMCVPEAAAAAPASNLLRRVKQITNGPLAVVFVKGDHRPPPTAPHPSPHQLPPIMPLTASQTGKSIPPRAVLWRVRMGRRCQRRVTDGNSALNGCATMVKIVIVFSSRNKIL
jgi:hypothetical protein